MAVRSVGGGSQRYTVESCDTLEPKGESNREYKADLRTGGVLSTRRNKKGIKLLFYTCNSCGEAKEGMDERDLSGHIVLIGPACAFEQECTVSLERLIL